MTTTLNPKPLSTNETIRLMPRGIRDALLADTPIEECTPAQAAWLTKYQLTTTKGTWTSQGRNLKTVLKKRAGLY